jgi:hypothetical protein
MKRSGERRSGIGRGMLSTGSFSCCARAIEQERNSNITDILYFLIISEPRKGKFYALISSKRCIFAGLYKLK